MKILILHNEVKPFRLPLFQYLDKNFDTRFYILRKNTKTSHCMDNVVYGRYFRVPKMQDLEIPLDLWSYLCKEKPDIIISTDLGYAITYIGFIYSQIYNVKFCLWNEQWHHVKHPRRYVTRWLEKYICKKSDLIFAFGNKHAKYAMSLGATPDTIDIVPNAVPDINKLEEEKLDIPELDSDSIFKIVCPARLIKVKGHVSLIHAMSLVVKKLPMAKLFIVGSGPDYKELTKLVLKLNLEKHVYISGESYNEYERNYLLSKADLVVLASIDHRYVRALEAWGLIVNEAMQYRKKIIVSDATGVAGELIVHNETGLVFENNNSYDICEKILSAAFMDDDWILMLDNAEEIYKKNYAIDVLIKKFDDGLRRLCE